MQTTQQQTGALSEAKARQFLEEKGLTFVTQNYRVKSGEIDLIMQQRQRYIFVEVRCRFNPDYGTGIETVTKAKQKRLIRAATQYLVEHHLYNKVDCRFDVIGIDVKHNITWIDNAFVAD